MFSVSAFEKYQIADLEKNGAEMKLQVEAYAKTYLEKIGSKADFQLQID